MFRHRTKRLEIKKRSKNPLNRPTLIKAEEPPAQSLPVLTAQQTLTVKANLNVRSFQTVKKPQSIIQSLK